MDAFGFNIEASLAAFATLPNETGIEVNRHEMLFTSNWILEAVTTGAADARDVESAVDSVVIDVDCRAHDAGDFKGRTKDRPWKPSKLPGEDLSQTAQLFVTDLWRHDKNGFSVSVVNRLRPVNNCDCINPAQVNITTMPLDDLVPYCGFATAVR